MLLKRALSNRPPSTLSEFHVELSVRCQLFALSRTEFLQRFRTDVDALMHNASPQPLMRQVRRPVVPPRSASLRESLEHAAAYFGLLCKVCKSERVRSAAPSFPGSAWERTAVEAPPLTNRPSQRSGEFPRRTGEPDSRDSAAALPGRSVD